MGEDEENQLTAEEQELYRKIKEKKKMKKKIKLEEQQLQQQEMELGEKTHLMEESAEREQRKKKKNKNKIKLEEEEEEEQQQQQQRQEIELEEKTQLIEENDEKENRKKKKKKKKKREDTIDEHEEQKEIPLKEVEVAEEDNEEEMEEVIVEEVNAKVEVVGRKEDKFAPIVCYYSSGFSPQRKSKNSGEEEEDDDDGVEVKTFRTETRVEVVVTPKDYKLDFVGESHSGEPAASQVCCYSLAIFDKESQTLKIVPVAANKILRLEPKVRTSSICNKEPLKELKEEDQTPAKKAHDIDRIITAYGTKTANRNAKRLQNLYRPEDAETQKAIDEKTQNVKLNKKALDTASGAPTRNIPPHDSTADTPEKAYPIDRIILPGEWDSLLDILELVQSQADIKPDTYPSFVCNRVHKLLEIQDEEERKKFACIFSYITHLIKFRDQRSVGRNSSLRNLWTPTILNTKFMSMFADSEKYNPSPEKINLLISYVLVLTLIADGYQTDIADIARDLKMSVVDLREHYFNLGCKAKKEQKVMMFTLPTPLEFPKLRMRGPKRKR